MRYLIESVVGMFDFAKRLCRNCRSSLNLGQWTLRMEGIILGYLLKSIIIIYIMIIFSKNENLNILIRASVLYPWTSIFWKRTGKIFLSSINIRKNFTWSIW